jgi:hypothetical protein
MPSERCRCPGDWNVIAPQGMCPRCGAEGSKHQQALREALAAGRWRAAAEDAWGRGWAGGWQAGLAEGMRRQAALEEMEREAG